MPLREIGKPQKGGGGGEHAKSMSWVVGCRDQWLCGSAGGAWHVVCRELSCV